MLGTRTSVWMHRAHSSRLAPLRWLRSRLVALVDEASAGRADPGGQRRDGAGQVQVEIPERTRHTSVSTYSADSTEKATASAQKWRNAMIPATVTNIDNGKTTPPA